MIIARTSFVIAALMLLLSCGTGLNVSKSQVKPFDKEHSFTVDNSSFKVHGRKYGDPTFLTLLEIYHATADSVNIEITDSLKLQVTYYDSATFKKKLFDGRFSEKGYYELFLRNESKVIPVVFSRHNVNRIRLALTTEGDLLVDNQWDESGRILVLGVGDKGRRQSYFRTKK